MPPQTPVPDVVWPRSSTPSALLLHTPRGLRPFVPKSTFSPIHQRLPSVADPTKPAILSLDHLASRVDTPLDPPTEYDLKLEADALTPGADDRPKQTRRLVACKLCHSLKVKCTPLNPDDPNLTCLRCKNAGRVCEIDVTQTRKRRRKDPGADKGSSDADTIAKLQKKIERLEKMLGQRAATKNIDLPEVLLTDLPPFISKHDLEREIAIFMDLLLKLLDLTNLLKETANRRTALLKQNRVVDIVLAGHISEDEVAERLRLYRELIYPEHPFVEIPPTYGVAEMRREMPYLLNLIVSITNSVVDPAISQDKVLLYDNFAVETLSLEVLAVGLKLVELIQALMLLCVWYNLPELFRQRRYQLLNSLLVLMLHDLGIFNRPTYHYNGLGVGPAGPLPPVLLEHRALVLVLYFSTVSICLILRRTIYVKWTPYVEECCAILEKELDPRWYKLAVFLRLLNTLDRIHHIVHALDTLERRNMPLTFVIHELQKLLLIIRNKISSDDHRTLAYYFSVEAYLHEPNLGLILDGDDHETAQLLRRLIRAILNCTNLCLNALEEFCKLQPRDIITIPFFYALRIVYTAGMLLRLRFLILLLPSLIEKDLVPQKAIFAIQGVNKLVDAALSLSHHNYFLRKTRLVIQLFIQTYTTQVQELLRKNGATPQNLRPHAFSKQELSEMNKLSQLYNKDRDMGNNVLTNENGKVGASQSLDMLSYAAGMHLEKELLPVAQMTGAVPVPPPILPQAPMQRAATMSHPINHPPPTSAALNRAQTLNYAPTQLPLSQLPQSFFRGVAGQQTRHNSMLSDTLPEQLENSYLALNDEFWADLLSQDSDKVNFSSNIGGGANEEVFFNNNF